MKTIGIFGLTDPLHQQRSHDHGVALFENGSLLHALELERYSGIKHDGHISDHIEDIVAPWLSQGNYRFALANSFLGNGFSSKNGIIKFPENVSMSVPEMIREVIPNHWLVCHEMAHIGSCLPFYGAFKPNSLLIHIDGGASDSCASAWFYDGKFLSHLDHGWHSALKTAINNFNDNPLTAHILNTSIEAHLSMPGKLMGLASYGNYSTKFHKHLIQNNWKLDEKVLSSNPPQFQYDIAICMQKELEHQVLSYIKKNKKSTCAKYLYYSGGAALNIHTNFRIENELNFNSIYIPPIPSDCGLAIGSAAFLEWLHGKCNPIKTAFFQAEEPKVLNIKTKITIIKSIKKVADLINNGHVVGCFTGKGELGPRALGHRSLLARPDKIPLRQYLSESMKQREWYRPVAPMMLPEIARQSLIGYKKTTNLSRFMLGAWKIRRKWISKFAGCIHADGTVRAQVINNLPENTHLYRLLVKLKEKYKIFGLINTSFNKKGMPIVNTLSEATDQLEQMSGKFLWTPKQPKIEAFNKKMQSQKYRSRSPASIRAR